MRTAFLIMVVLLQGSAISQSNFWQQTSGPTLGDIYSIAVTPGNRIFAGFNGGIAVSTDAGVSWERISGNLRNCNVEVVLAADDSLVFAGTWGQGVFKSVDGGYNWAQLAYDFGGWNITGIVKTPSRRILVSSLSGLFMSTDEGTTWTNLLAVTARTVAVDSVGRILVGTDHCGEHYYEYGGIYKSDDDGVSWERVNTGLPGASFLTKTLAFGRAGTAYLGLEGEFFRSTDRGTTWLPVFVGDVSTVTVARNGFLYAGDGFIGALYRSLDEGVSWSRIGNGIRYPKIFSLAENSNGDLFAGTNGGVYRSIDEGIFWRKVNSGYTYVTTTSIAVHPDSSIWAAAGSSDVGYGVFVSTDNGVSWIDKSFGSSKLFCSFVAVDRAGYVYCGTDQGVYVSNDRGETWTPRNAGLDYLYVYAIFVGDQDYVFVSVGGMNSTDSSSVYFTEDHGTIWTKASSGLPYPGFVAWMALDSAKCLYASVSNRGLYRSDNHGGSWKAVNNGIPDTTSVGPIAVSRTDQVCVSVWPFGVFRSTDNGAVWIQQGNFGLSEPGILALVFNRLGNLYAGTWDSIGVFMSRNSGSDWTPLNSGLGLGRVWSLGIDNMGFLLAGTYGNGVFRSLVSTDDVRIEGGTIPFGFSLSQNYPNPFNPSTSIAYSVGGVRGQASGVRNVKLMVYDILGREVAVLVNEKKAPGKYTVQFDGSKLASGIYFYRLQAGSLVETKKMVVVR